MSWCGLHVYSHSWAIAIPSLSYCRFLFQFPFYVIRCSGIIECVPIELCILHRVDTEDDNLMHFHAIQSQKCGYSILFEFCFQENESNKSIFGTCFQFDHLKLHIYRESNRMKKNLTLFTRSPLYILHKQRLKSFQDEQIVPHTTNGNNSLRPYKLYNKNEREILKLKTSFQSNVFFSQFIDELNFSFLIYRLDLKIEMENPFYRFA